MISLQHGRNIVSASKLTPSNLIIMQLSSFGRIATHGLIDQVGIAKDGVDYSFCKSPEIVESLLLPNERQLILSSHIRKCCDCVELARHWRTINPEAIVVALTSSSFVNPFGSCVEGAVSKRIGADVRILWKTIELFRKGANRGEIRKVLLQEIP